MKKFEEFKKVTVNYCKKTGEMLIFDYDTDELLAEFRATEDF